LPVRLVTALDAKERLMSVFSQRPGTDVPRASAPGKSLVLPGLMVLTIVLGLVLIQDVSTKPGPSAVEIALAIVSLACFVVVFALHLVGWLLREHDQWRRAHGFSVSSSPAPPVDAAGN
jgi:hypothetical protein